MSVTLPDRADAYMAGQDGKPVFVVSVVPPCVSTVTIVDDETGAIYHTRTTSFGHAVYPDAHKGDAPLSHADVLHRYTVRVSTTGGVHEEHFASSGPAPRVNVPLAAFTGICWCSIVGIPILYFCVNSAHMRSHLGISPYARDKQEYTDYHQGPDYNRTWIALDRRLRGLPPVPAPPPLYEDTWMLVARGCWSVLPWLVLAAVPLTVYVWGGTGKYAAYKVITTVGARRTGSQPTTDTSSVSASDLTPRAPFRYTLASEILAELASDAFWHLVKRRRDRSP
jgi:hypothetical protein